MSNKPTGAAAVLTATQAFEKAAAYCAYQERSQDEVRQKLAAWNWHGEDAENTLIRLIEEGFLNEERFALAYVQGKFNQKGWGRLKIRQGLKLKKVSQALIQKALYALDEEAYLDRLKHLLDQKEAQLREKNPYIRQQKLLRYALSRGFEPELVRDCLKAEEE